MAWDVEGLVASLAGRSEHTRRAYEHDAAEFVAWAERGGCAEPSALDRRTLRRYLAYLETRGFARRSVARKAAAVRALIAHLRHTGQLTADPGRALHAPKREARLPRVPSAADAAAMLDGAATALAGVEDPVARALAQRDVALLELLYGAGLRVSEACGLGLAGCDLAGALVTVVGKRAKTRRVPIGVPARAALDAYLHEGRPVLAVADSPAVGVPHPPGHGLPDPGRAPGRRRPPAARRAPHPPARAAPRLRDASARRRRRPARRAGAPRPR